MVFIYVLALQKNKFYVGKTRFPESRIESHFNALSGGSAWTRKYKPLKVEKIYPNCDDYDEDKYTRMYMDKYGMENVRGGAFVTVTLQKEVIKVLNQMSQSTNNKCFCCGEYGHFIRDCTNRKKHPFILSKPTPPRCLRRRSLVIESDEEEDKDEDDSSYRPKKQKVLSVNRLNRRITFSEESDEILEEKDSSTPSSPDCSLESMMMTEKEQEKEQEKEKEKKIETKPVFNHSERTILTRAYCKLNNIKV
jgi:hypothetical protein